MNSRTYSKLLLPGRVAQSVTCLATDASLTADPGVASSIPARSHTFVEIDHEIISTVILLPSAESFKKGLSPPVKYFTDRSKAVLLLWIFYVFVLSCVCYVLCASVYMCFVVTCWERADLLALVCGVFCEFVTFPLVSWVRCGT